MEFNTVDGFQGREVDILVLTTVRSSVSDSRLAGKNSSGIGFVADIRRMNVALTRAKLSLWIVGNARTLQTNLHWATLVQNAKERNLFISVTRPYDSFFERSKSYSSMVDIHSSYGKKNDTAKSRCEVEQDKNSDRDAHRMKAKLGGGKPKPSSIAGYVNAALKSPKRSREGSKVIPENVQLEPDSQREDNRRKSKPSFEKSSKREDKGGRSKPSFEKSSKREDKGGRSKPLDVKTTTMKDLLAARKRQRDDIEALLPSALISSKKAGMSSNASTVKKPPLRNN